MAVTPALRRIHFGPACAILAAAMMALEAGAAPVSIFGQVGIVHTDSGAGIYTGTAPGATFFGSIDDVSAAGSISDGLTLTAFGCCIAAGALSVTNDATIDAEQATLLNTLLGAVLFSSGDMVDEVTLEGDAETAGPGRIEVGVSWILAAGAFSDDNPSNYPFDPADLLMALFFVAEFDIGDEEIFNASGRLTPVPVPAAGWLLLCGLLGIARGGARAQRVFGP